MRRFAGACAAGLLFVALPLFAASGCSAFKRDSLGMDAYEQAWREIEQPTYGVQQASFEAEELESPGTLDFMKETPKRVASSAKRMAGLGPKPEEARRIYGEAEAKFNEAANLPEGKRRGAFLEAAELYDKSASLWPDSDLHQDGLFMAGESYFFADRYPQANDQYEQLLKQFPHTRHLDKAEARRFSLAQYWLDLHRETREPFLGVSLTDKSRPWRDTYGHALRVFDRIRIDDPTGRLADDATMAAANAHFKEGKFAKADEFYTDLRKTFPSSEHQFLAHLLGLQCKLEIYQGPDYSGQALNEAEGLLDQLRKQFPMDVQEHREYLNKVAGQVRHLQAERDWKQGRYHELRKEYGAARYYYDSLIKEYSGTSFADLATERVNDFKDEPAEPPQRLKWLVNLFPDAEPARPIIASGGDLLRR